MAQHDYVIANGTGAAVRSDLNNALAAIVSTNAGTTEPTTTYAHMLWADTTANQLKLRNAANNAWIVLRDLDGDLVLGDGSAATPSLQFSTSGTDTGLYSPGADQVAVSTGGTERVEWGASEVVFNDGGENYDFRIEGDTNSTLFFVDASADTVEINGDVTITDKIIHSGDTNTAIRFPAADTVSVEVDGGEALRVDSSKRLLAGTSTSRSTAISDPLFQVEGTTYGGSSMQMICNSAADAFTCAHLAFGRSKTTAIGGTGQVANGDRLGAISWNGAQNSTLASIAGLIECYVDGEVQTAGDTTDMPGRLVFSTTADGASSPTERMRITSDGQMLVGGTAAAGNSNNVIQLGKYGAAIAFGNSSTSGNVTAVEFYRGTTKVGEIYTTGTSSTTYSTSSDYRLKENVVPLHNAVNRVNSLKPCRFNFISDPDIVIDGFLAHEAQTVVPEAIKGVKDEVDADGNPIYQGIDQSKLVPLLTAALQEALAEIESLKVRVTALEA
jgi:hypothetical protein